jgi:hypothetical protein
MGSIVIAFIVLFFAQLLIGIAAYFHNKAIPGKFLYTLTHLNDPASTLESYIKIYRKIGIKVNAQIDQPALAKEDFILIKRDTVYDKDLYTNFYVLLQLELTKKTYNFLRLIKPYQNILFYLSLIIFIFGLSWQTELKNYLIILAFTLEIIILIITLLAYELFLIALNESFEVSKDLLNLDELEQVRTKKLINALKYQVFEYPIDIPLKLIHFFSF